MASVRFRPTPFTDADAAVAVTTPPTGARMTQNRPGNIRIGSPSMAPTSPTSPSNNNNSNKHTPFTLGRRNVLTENEERRNNDARGRPLQMPKDANECELQVLPQLLTLHEDATRKSLVAVQQQQAAQRFKKFQERWRLRTRLTPVGNPNEVADIILSFLRLVNRSEMYFCMRLHAFILRVTNLQRHVRVFLTAHRKTVRGLVENWMLHEASARRSIKLEIKRRVEKGNMSAAADRIIRHLWSMYMDCWRSRDRMTASIKALWRDRRKTFSVQFRAWQRLRSRLSNPIDAGWSPCCYFSSRNVTPAMLGMVEATDLSCFSSSLSATARAFLDEGRLAQAHEQRKLQGEYYCMLLSFRPKQIITLIQLRQRLGKSEGEDSAVGTLSNISMAQLMKSSEEEMRELREQQLAAERDKLYDGEFFFPPPVHPKPPPPFRKFLQQQSLLPSSRRTTAANSCVPLPPKAAAAPKRRVLDVDIASLRRVVRDRMLHAQHGTYDDYLHTPRVGTPVTRERATSTLSGRVASSSPSVSSATATPRPPPRPPPQQQRSSTKVVFLHSREKPSIEKNEIFAVASRRLLPKKNCIRVFQ
eukprot:PhM_4_TR15111/c0_g1_i1/m.78923